MSPYAAPPGTDVGITSEDYEWLLSQCKAKADWQCNFRISFAGRLTKCPRPSFEYRGKLDYSYALGRIPYIGDGSSPGGQITDGDYTRTITKPFCCLEPTYDDELDTRPVDVCGPPFGDFRARATPLRQEPEWQFNKLDVEAAWRQIDEEALDKCDPSAMLALAQDAVDTLRRWPVVLSSCDCPQERRLEVRLALILNAYVAKPHSTHPRREFFEAVACKAKLKALRGRTMPGTSAAQPGFIDMGTVTQLAAPVSAVRPGELPAARWHSKLQALGLHIRPVEGKDIFAHTPAKTILKESLQEAVLRKFGAYEPLQLCYKATRPWERFFIFDQAVLAYNRTGMRAEDPNAHKWSQHKLCINYTELAPREEWSRVLDQVYNRDLHELIHLLKETRGMKSTTSTLTRSAFLKCVSGADLYDWLGPDSKIWDWYCQHHGGQRAQAALLAARSSVHGTWLLRKMKWQDHIGEITFLESRAAESVGYPKNERPVYFRYSRYSVPQVSYPDKLFSAVPLLLWLGGTYARDPKDFPAEQSSAMWLETHLLPLGLAAPLQHHCRSRDAAQKAWNHTRWHGPPAHPLACGIPFPYASASMKKFASHYLSAREASKRLRE